MVICHHDNMKKIITISAKKAAKGKKMTQNA